MTSDERLLIYIQNAFNVKKFDVSFTVQVHIVAHLKDGTTVSCNGECLSETALNLISELSKGNRDATQIKT